MLSTNVSVSDNDFDILNHQSHWSPSPQNLTSWQNPLHHLRQWVFTELHSETYLWVTCGQISGQANIFRPREFLMMRFLHIYSCMIYCLPHYFFTQSTIRALISNNSKYPASGMDMRSQKCDLWYQGCLALLLSTSATYWLISSRRACTRSPSPSPWEGTEVMVQCTQSCVLCQHFFRPPCSYPTGRPAAGVGMSTSFCWVWVWGGYTLVVA